MLNEKPQEQGHRLRAAIICLSIGIAMVEQAPGAPPDPAYKLQFSDEFDGPELAGSRWSTRYDYWNVRTIPQLHQQQYFIEKGYNGLSVNPHPISKGVLSLVADRSPDPEKTGKLPYYSAMISTEKSFNTRYGYFETRLRAPKGQGFWPTVWMIPIQGHDYRPEIDVLEVLGHQTSVLYQNSHPKEGDNSVQRISGSATQRNLIDAADGFHIYGLEWTQDTIRWYIDNKQTQAVKNFAFEPLYYLICFVVGGDWPGKTNASTPFPAFTDIDYVRIYKKPEHG